MFEKFDNQALGLISIYSEAVGNSAVLI